MATRRLAIGDVFVIPLPDGRSAYCQYIHRNEQMGYLVKVFDRINDHLLPVEQLRNAGSLFPPVFVGLPASVKAGRWRWIGRLPVENFQFPLFRATSATKPGQYNNWWIFDGQREESIGELPPEFRSLEIAMVWGDELLEDRISTGKNPFAGIC